MALSYRDKYERSRPSYVKVNGRRFADLPAGTTVLVPSPHDIEAEIRSLRGAETLTFTQLRERLAARHAADGTCPVMTSMNLRIVAEIALAELDDGLPADAVTEVWRAIDPRSRLARKLPGGPDRIEALRAGLRQARAGTHPLP
jgi:hypothetical protein